jgi:hypothetical protein
VVVIDVTQSDRRIDIVAIRIETLFELSDRVLFVHSLVPQTESYKQTIPDLVQRMTSYAHAPITATHTVNSPNVKFTAISVRILPSNAPASFQRCLATCKLNGT